MSILDKDGNPLEIAGPVERSAPPSMQIRVGKGTVMTFAHPGVKNRDRITFDEARDWIMVPLETWAALYRKAAENAQQALDDNKARRN